jgi:hypothetical protein
LSAPAKLANPPSAEAERILYFTLMRAIDDGLIRTMEDALRVLRHASQPLGPMGAEWLERQARALRCPSTVRMPNTVPPCVVMEERG